MTSATETGVAIVEDNAALGASLRLLVESTAGLHCVGVWTSGEDALKKIDAFRPDVVLMDINLPGISGIETTARIKLQLPEIQVIMVTVYRDHDKIFAALKAGASGYLLKRSSPAEVRAAIEDVRTGGAPMSAEIARRVVEAFHQPIVEPTEQANLSPAKPKSWNDFATAWPTRKSLTNSTSPSKPSASTSSISTRNSTSVRAWKPR